jgi:hypothetical protein
VGKHILLIDLSRPDPKNMHIQEIQTDNKKLPIEILRRQWPRLKFFEPDKKKKKKKNLGSRVYGFGR